MKNQSASGAEEVSIEEGFVAIGQDGGVKIEGRSVLRLSVDGHRHPTSNQADNQAGRIICPSDSMIRVLCKIL